MIDPWRHYDRWKTRSPEDEEEEQERRRLKALDDEDRADELYQRFKEGEDADH